MSETTCSCVFENDSATYWCALPAGHEGDHEATVTWPDAGCSNWQHCGWDEAGAQISHTREGKNNP